MNRLEIVFALCFAVLLARAAPAHADLYRCIGPDGGLVYTDDESICPGAATHESSGKIQTHRSGAPPSRVADSPGVEYRTKPSRADGQTAMKKHWQAKKRAKEGELRALEERSEYLSRFVTGCNRGAQVTARDETGIKRTVSCDEIRAEYQQTLERLEPIREYLDSGLRRDCRKAGCLPGWIR
jgi:hypothetical protein